MPELQRGLSEGEDVWRSGHRVWRAAGSASGWAQGLQSPAGALTGDHTAFTVPAPRWGVVADPLTWCLCRFLGRKYVSVIELSVKAPLTTVPGDSPLGARSVTLAKGTDLDAAGLPRKSWLSGSELFSLWSVSWILCVSVSYLQHGTCLTGFGCGFGEITDVVSRVSDTRNVIAWVRCSAASGDVSFEPL